MTPISYAFSVATALLMLVIIVQMLRKKRLRERHALWWLVIGVLSLIAALFPSLLAATASLLGISLPISLVFFVGIVVLFMVSVQQSTELTKLEEQTRVLAEQQALLKLRVSELEATAQSSE